MYTEKAPYIKIYFKPHLLLKIIWQHWFTYCGNEDTRNWMGQNSLIVSLYFKYVVFLSFS